MPAGAKGANIRFAHVPRMQFAIDVSFAHAAGNKLGVLGTEIEDEDFLVHVNRGVKREGIAAAGRKRTGLPLLFPLPRSVNRCGSSVLLW